METSRVLDAGDVKGKEGAARPESETPLGEVYDVYAAPLYRYLLALVGSQQDAEDALQETFLAIVRRGSHQIRDFRSYLFQAARRQAVSVLRSRRRQRREAEAEAEGFWIDLGACRPEVRTVAIDIVRAFRSLPPEQREVIALHLCGGYSFSEIADLCAVPKSTAASRYRLAIAKLRVQLRGGAP